MISPWLICRLTRWRCDQFQPWAYDPGEATIHAGAVESKALIAGEDPVNTRVLELIVDLGNTVLTKRAVSDLIQ